MTDGCKALLAWIKSVTGLPAYAEPVSIVAELPYVSLSYQESGFGVDGNQSLTVWTRSDASYSEAYGIADLISQALGDQGAVADGGTLYIRKGSPFAQNRLDDTKTIRAVLINLTVTYYGGN
jgi:hypothetical protein